MTRALLTALFLTLFSQTAWGDEAKIIYGCEIIETVKLSDDVPPPEPDRNDRFYFSIGDGYLKFSEKYFGGASAKLIFVGKGNKELFRASNRWGSYSFKEGDFFFAESTFFSSWAGRAKCEKL
jgi:hypothetical protein